MRTDAKFRLLKLGNHLYERAYPLYWPLYDVYKRISDRTERKLLRGLVQPGMTVVDIGANIGIYTRFLAKLVGDTGRVIAFEPEPQNFERLLKNVAYFRNVDAVHAAVSDYSGDITLFCSQDLNVDHQTYDNGEMRKRVIVPAVSRDDYFERGQQIDLVKLDVQGFEFHVLKGARRLFQESANLVLLIEFWPYGLQMAGVEPDALLELVEEMGFLWRPTNVPFGSSAEVYLPDRRHEDQYCNLLLVKSASSRQSKNP